MATWFHFLFLLCCVSLTVAHGWSPKSLLFSHKQPLGGQHLVNAGKALQSAAQELNTMDYAGPHLLQDAGDSLVDVGHGWLDDNWEAVAYAAEDCSHSLYVLSQLQEPKLQTVYRGASGELHVVAMTSSSTQTISNLQSLGRYLQQVADETKRCKNSPEFRNNVRLAAKSIQALAEEMKMKETKNEFL